MRCKNELIKVYHSSLCNGMGGVRSNFMNTEITPSENGYRVLDKWFESLIEALYARDYWIQNVSTE